MFTNEVKIYKRELVNREWVISNTSASYYAHVEPKYSNKLNSPHNQPEDIIKVVIPSASVSVSVQDELEFNQVRYTISSVEVGSWGLNEELNNITLVARR